MVLPALLVLSLFAAAALAVAEIPIAEWNNITNSPEWDRHPIWSPDGSQLAYVRDEERGMSLVVANADGSSPRNVASATSFLFSPSWSPDGATILYEVGGQGVWKVDVATGQAEHAAGSTIERLAHPQWSPDGQFIAYHHDPSGGGDARICIVPTSGGERRVLQTAGGSDQFVTWSPDGQWVAFQKHQPADGLPTGVYAMRTDGSEYYRVTPDDLNSSEPAWSPDGSMIAFVGHNGSQYDLYVSTVDRRRTVQITDDQIAPSFPNWSVDSRQIAFTAFDLGNEGVPVDIYVVDVAGVLDPDGPSSVVTRAGWGELKDRSRLSDQRPLTRQYRGR